MSLSPGQKDLLEDLLRHNGFSVLEDVIAAERERLIDRLISHLDAEKTAQVRGEIQALDRFGRKALENLIRDTP